MASMVKLAEPHKVVPRFDPSPDLGRIGDAGIVLLQPRQVNAVLQAEFHMAMMQFEFAVAFAEVIAVSAERALRGLIGAPPLHVKVAIVGI
jgi:hypothetical protein